MIKLFPCLQMEWVCLFSAPRPVLTESTVCWVNMLISATQLTKYFTWFSWTRWESREEVVRKEPVHSPSLSTIQINLTLRNHTAAGACGWSVWSLGYHGESWLRNWDRTFSSRMNNGKDGKCGKAGGPGRNWPEEICPLLENMPPSPLPAPMCLIKRELNKWTESSVLWWSEEKEESGRCPPTLPRYGHPVWGCSNRSQWETFSTILQFWNCHLLQYSNNRLEI